mmetsp:Transcript_9228/g.16118  ORF Transcript_9228/g.16118 Transcript_9228/m.16118 type:complete len:87 (+) Transcript_9228:880-1140(+)
MTAMNTRITLLVTPVYSSLRLLYWKRPHAKQTAENASMRYPEIYTRKTKNDGSAMFGDMDNPFSLPILDSDFLEFDYKRLRLVRDS